MLKCKVGVPNPGVTETFGYTAVEMQAMGCIVTSICCPGFLDTVYKTGILYRSTSQLAKSIIALLQRENNDYKETYRFIKENFSFDAVLPQWEEMLKNIYKSSHLHAETKLVNPDYRNKKLKEWIRLLKKKNRIFKNLPPVESFYFMENKNLGRFLRKCIKRIVR